MDYKKISEEKISTAITDMKNIQDKVIAKKKLDSIEKEILEVMFSYGINQLSARIIIKKGWSL